MRGSPPVHLLYSKSTILKLQKAKVQTKFSPLHRRRTPLMRSILGGSIFQSFNLLQVGREIIDEIIPHLGVMLVKLLALHGVIGNSERSAGFKHECNGTLRDAHWLQFHLGGSLEFRIGNSVRNTTTFVRETTRLEFIRSAAISTVDETHKFRRDVAVVVRWTVGVACDIPSRGEDKNIGEGSCRIARFGGQNSEDGGVDVVNRDRADIDKLGQIILVWGIVSGPGDNVERTVLLS